MSQRATAKMHFLTKFTLCLTLALACISLLLGKCETGKVFYILFNTFFLFIVFVFLGDDEFEFEMKVDIYWVSRK